ncbi:MAG: NEW3 domain-containing protein, partial [Blastocatellia bacterium]
PVEGPAPQQTLAMAVPGQTFSLTARLYNRSSRPITPGEINLEIPAGWKSEVVKSDLKTLNSDDSAEVQFKVTVPQDAAYTRPYWHRDNTQQTIYQIDDPRYLTLPFPSYPVHALATYSLAGAEGEIRSVAKVKYVDPLYGQGERPLVVGSPISVELNPETGIIPMGRAADDEVTVGVRDNAPGAVKATLRLEAPKGWKIEPKKVDVAFSRPGEFASYKFDVKPGALAEARYDLKAVVEYSGKEYSEGYEVVARHDLGTFYYYHPAVEHISSVSVNLPAELKVGYIMGAGDDIPEVLKQLRINVQTISPAELASGDLSKYGTIVLGIRAYDVRADVRDNNKRLLDFVSRGGTLVVQYNQSVGTFNSGDYTPYPATATTKRVTVEEAPVKVLAPNDSVFNYPNKIGDKDFDGWVQERGTYFMDKWDQHYQPLLSSHDPGEEPLDGGLLRAAYGKGVYIYSGYAFFRQLPAGVPGGVRLFVNIISAGHSK